MKRILFLALAFIVVASSSAISAIIGTWLVQ